MSSNYRCEFVAGKFYRWNGGEKSSFTCSGSMNYAKENVCKWYRNTLIPEGAAYCSRIHAWSWDRQDFDEVEWRA